MQFAESLSPEDMKVFLQEADEQLQSLNDGLLSLERNESADVLAAIFRAAHTLKGSSAMVGHKQMTAVAHSMESLLDKVRKGTLKVTPVVVDALLHSVDALQGMKQEIAEQKVADHDFSGLLKELEAAADTGAGRGAVAGAAPVGGVLSPHEAREFAQKAVDAGLTAYSVHAHLEPESPFRAVRAFQMLTELRSLGQVAMSAPGEAQISAEEVGNDYRAVVLTGRGSDELRSALASVQDVVAVEVKALEASEEAAHEDVAHANAAGPERATGEAAGPGQLAVQSVRIDVAQLDGLMNLIGELVIDRTRIEQLGKSLSAKYQGDELVEALGKTSDHIVKVVNDLQEDFMKVRMLPVSTVFASFPRMMRDLARRLDKQLDLRVSGGETEIDKTVIERVRDPLVHLLRNALDHGLEGPDARRLAGKPPAGAIELSAFHEQGQIIIRVKDDGRGIDAEGVKASAVSKGMISADAAARMGTKESLDLIFLPGTSTKESASDVSGRGVGMDIVRSNVEAIGGLIDVTTEPGRGTEFTMRLPLTLATVKSVLVTSGPTIYAVPLMYVLEVVSLSPDQVPTVQGRDVLRLRDRVVPVVDLAEATGTVVEGHKAIGAARRVVVTRAGERLAGLGVDELLEPMEVVVKPLGKQFSGARGISGASILGDGRVVLILDVPGLIAAAAVRQQAEERVKRDVDIRALPAVLPLVDAEEVSDLAQAA